MTLINIQKLKSQYKAALKSGKIVYVGYKERHLDFDFRCFLKENLNVEEWRRFEEKEYSFRKSIASKKINYGDFHCKGNINLWEKIIKSLTSIFYKRKIFLHTKKINEPWSLQFIKYCCRIVKSFPTDPDIINYINKSSFNIPVRQLFLISKTIRSYFSINKSVNNDN